LDLPTLHEFISKTKPSHGSEFAGGMLGSAASYALDPMLPALNAGKYFISHPTGEKMLSKIPRVGKKFVNWTNEKFVNKPIGSAFEKGLMEGKPMSRKERFLGNLLLNPFTTEMAHTAGGIGAAMGAATPEIYRKNILEHTKRLVTGDPTAFQMAPPMHEQISKYVAPALAVGGAATALGGAGYLAGRKMRRQSEEHQKKMEGAMLAPNMPAPIPIGQRPGPRIVPPIQAPEAMYG
jgi:hypothetical protein